MAQSQFVIKTQLFGLIRKLIGAQQTGLLSILTDTKRSVLLRFSQGKLIHSYCRTKDVGDAIQVLNECQTVKFTFAPASTDAAPEVIPVETFLQLLDPGQSDGGLASQPASSAPQVGADSDALTIPQTSGDPDALLRETLLTIALEYAGPIAEMVVDEAFQNTSDVRQAIDYITELIPDANHAAAFRSAARERIPQISF